MTETRDTKAVTDPQFNSESGMDNRAGRIHSAQCSYAKTFELKFKKTT